MNKVLLELLRKNNNHYLWNIPFNKWTPNDIENLKNSINKPSYYNKKNLSEFRKNKIKESLENEIIQLSDDKVKKRLQIIFPILLNPGNLELVKKISAENNIGVSTLYRWVNLYKCSGAHSIKGKPKTGGKGVSRLSFYQEEIITKHLKSRKPLKILIKLINHDFSALNIVPPHSNTIRNRILKYKLNKEIMISNNF